MDSRTVRYTWSIAATHKCQVCNMSQEDPKRGAKMARKWREKGAKRGELCSLSLSFYSRGPRPILLARHICNIFAADLLCDENESRMTRSRVKGWLSLSLSLFKCAVFMREIKAQEKKMSEAKLYKTRHDTNSLGFASVNDNGDLRITKTTVIRLLFMSLQSVYDQR